MKPISCTLAAALLFLFAATPLATAQNGHPMWWWDMKSSDLIVQGSIRYDAAKHYQIKPINIRDQEARYYWIVGTLKIDRVLYINRHSEHLESYQEYLKNVDKEHAVLIPAFGRKALFSNSGSGPDVIQPILGLDIPNGKTVFNLSQIFVFPILSLKLNSVVPAEKMREAFELAGKRTNNFVTVKQAKKKPDVLSPSRRVFSKWPWNESATKSL